MQAARSATLDEVVEDLGAVFGHMSAAAKARAFEVAAGLDLSMNQMRTMFCLYQHEVELALHELAEQTGMSLATAGRAVDVLVKEYIATRREDEHDRRVKRVAIAERGRQIVNTVHAAHRDVLRGLVETLDEGQRRRLREALAPVIDHLEEQGSCGK